MEAITVKANGEIIRHEKDLEFKKIQETCGGYVERIQCEWGEVWVNENGISERLPFNEKVTKAINATRVGALNGPFTILGDTVIRAKKGFGYCADTGLVTKDAKKPS